MNDKNLCLNRKKVGVVILTYNRLELLKITLCKVLTQSYENVEILVVDNHSTDGTLQYLKDQESVPYLALGENMGPAGGFHEGIKYFAENTGVDYVWAMDDDFFPFRSCLQILMEAVNHENIVFPYVREKDFALRLKPGWWGVLIPMSIIRKVGYPRRELFFWSEDTEYFQHRIRDVNGYSNTWVPRAKGVHFTKREKNFRPPWRYYYEIRNTTYSRLYIRKRNLRRLFKLCKSWSVLFAIIIFKESNKLEKMKWFLKGTRDGLTKRLGKKMELHDNLKKDETFW